LHFAFGHPFNPLLWAADAKLLRHVEGIFNAHGSRQVLNRDELSEILAIGHATRRMSLRDAIRRSCYQERRNQFDVSDLIPLIQERPELVTQWVTHSQDKRTKGGYALLGSSPEEVAEYVVREIDFWAWLE
jgi:hypothetical protein